MKRIAATIFISAWGLSAAMAVEPMLIDHEIRFRDAGSVSSQAVCLQDLVDDGIVQGRCAVERDKCCRWSLGGERTRTFKRAEVESELAKVRFGGLRFKLSGEEIAVTQTHRELNAREIQDKIKAAAITKYGEDARGLAISSMKMRLPAYIPFSEESDWDVVLPEVLAEHGAIKIISTRDTTKILGWAQASLKLEGDVYLAKRALHPLEAIQANDFEIGRADLLKIQAGGTTPFQKDRLPTGARARQTIAKGAALTAAQIERAPNVALGDTVTLILRSDTLRISTKAVVQGSAAIGDMVTVTLTRYNRTFRGRLLDGRLVEVWL